MELLRIISMLLVVLVHCNYGSLGWNFDVNSVSGFCRVLCEQLCLICVNVFVLISGWFGIKPKITGILSLLFQVLFFTCVIFISCLILNHPVSIKDLIRSLYFGASYWFIPAYIILYVVTPILNKFIEHSSQKEFRTILIAFFSVQMLFGFIKDYGGFAEGYSAMSFIGLYLLGRYCKIWPCKMTSLSWKTDLSIYVLISVFASLFYTFVPSFFYLQTRYNNPVVILSALYVLLAFTKMPEFKSQIINRVASSCFAVYLLHASPFVADLFLSSMLHLYGMTSGFLYISLSILIAVLMLFASSVIDGLRIVLWNFIQNHTQIEELNNIVSLQHDC